MRLPEFVTELSPVRETLEAADRGGEALRADVEEAERQFYVSTATRGLSLWESDYSLENQGPDEARRTAVWTALAGGKTLTPEFLEELCVSLGKGDRGQVNEDFANWTITAYSAAEGRVPEGAAALDAAIRRLKPAHLAVEAHPVGVFFPEAGRAAALTGKQMAEISGGDALRTELTRGAALTGGLYREVFGGDRLLGEGARTAALTGGVLREYRGNDGLRGDTAFHGAALTGCMMILLQGSAVL